MAYLEVPTQSQPQITKISDHKKAQLWTGGREDRLIKELAQAERQYFHWFYRGVQGGKPLGSKTKVEDKSTHENIMYIHIWRLT